MAIGEQATATGTASAGEDVIETGQSTSDTGLDRMLDMVYESARHSLSFGVAASQASNVNHNSGVSTTSRKDQTMQREGVKKMGRKILKHRGRPYQKKKQAPGAKWTPNRKRALSPSRY